MAHIDQAHFTSEKPIEAAQSPQSASEALNQAKQDKLTLMAKITHPELKKLAETELAELNTLESQKTGDTAGILVAHKEFEADIKALDTIEEKFNSFEHYSEFTNFLSNGKLSPNELESFYSLIADQISNNDGVDLEMEFELEGFPLTRESYTLFADKFGIPTSTEIGENLDNLNEQNKQLFLNALPVLKSIQ